MPKTLKEEMKAVFGSITWGIVLEKGWQGRTEPGTGPIARSMREQRVKYGKQWNSAQITESKNRI
jgi:hypothetical protein